MGAYVQAEGGRWSRRRSQARLEEAATPRSEGVASARKTRAAGTVARAQCRVSMLQSKLRGAELRLAGQYETIKVLEASLSAKDSELQRLAEVRARPRLMLQRWRRSFSASLAGFRLAACFRADPKATVKEGRALGRCQLSVDRVRGNVRWSAFSRK